MYTWASYSISVEQRTMVNLGLGLHKSKKSVQHNGRFHCIGIMQLDYDIHNAV